MRAAWIIAAREVREKARLFVVCAALALVPFVATLLPGTRGQAEETIAVVGGFLAAILGIGIAATFGASTLVRDLAERRMSFYFTKPVSASALWIGKASAALFVSLTCLAILAVPSMLMSGKRWAMQWMGQWEPLAVMAAAMVVLFFVAHILSTVIRSRSPLLALDFVFLLVTAAVMYLIVQPLFLSAAILLASRVVGALAGAVLLAIAIAPVWQLANGRSDIRRNHAALMRFLWPAVAVVLLVAGGVVTWLVRVAPQDLELTSVEQPARGATAIVAGRAPYRLDFQPTYLLDRAAGRFTRIASPAWWGAQFSEDGRVVVWLQPVGRFSRSALELHTRRGATGIVVSMSATFVLSRDGTRVAIVSGESLSVYDVESGTLLASTTRLDRGARPQMFFVTPDLVRVYEHQYRMDGEAPLRVVELDVRARALRVTGVRMLQAARHPVSVSGDGSRMFVQGANAIADGRTAETIVQLAVSNVSHARMLHDGSVALIAYREGVPHLRTFTRDGAPRHDVAFPGTRSIWISGETENGKLILAAYGRTMYVVDFASGAIERKLDGVRGPVPRWSADPRLIRYGATQELLGIDRNGKLFPWKFGNEAAFARP